jgi:hypothetical protein
MIKRTEGSSENHPAKYRQRQQPREDRGLDAATLKEGRMKIVKQIPATVTTTDAAGKQTHRASAFGVLPPPPGKCQVCAAEHDPHLPHDAQSLYYQIIFEGMVGRSATWADAMAHCDDTIKDTWKAELQKLGAWTEPPAGETPVLHHGL